jgi:hypothetical protein
MRQQLRLARPLLLAAALTALPAGAFAQWDPGATASLGAGYGAINLSIGQGVLSRNAMARRNGRRPDPGRTITPDEPGAADAARFDFTRSPEVTDDVREQMVAVLTRANPANRPMTEHAFANDVVFQKFQALLAGYGFSATNLVDVMTGYNLITWEIATGGEAADAGAIRAVRRQLLRAAAANPAVLRMSNAEKQKLAEWMAYQVVMDAVLNDAFIRQGDNAKLQDLRAKVRDAAMRLGPDPTRLKLTETGFTVAER